LVFAVWGPRSVSIRVDLTTLRPFPRNLSIPGSFSRARSPLQSSFAPIPARIPYGRETSCQGFVPHRDFTAARPLPRGLPSPRYVPSSGVLSLSTVYSALRLCRLVPSHSRVQGPPRSGSSRSPQPPFLVGRSLPPRRRNSPAHRPKPMPTSAFLDLEVLIRVEQRSDGSAVSLASSRSPLRVSSPPGPLLRLRSWLTQDAPPMRFSNLTFACALVRSDPLQRLPTKNSANPSPNQPTCPRISSLPLNPSTLRLLDSE